jgi:hypothetical protein
MPTCQITSVRSPACACACSPSRETLDSKMPRANNVHALNCYDHGFESRDNNFQAINRGFDSYRPRVRCSLKRMQRCNFDPKGGNTFEDDVMKNLT